MGIIFMIIFALLSVLALSVEDEQKSLDLKTIGNEIDLMQVDTSLATQESAMLEETEKRCCWRRRRRGCRRCRRRRSRRSPKGDTDAGDVDAAVEAHAGEEEWPLTEREELHA